MLLVACNSIPLLLSLALLYLKNTLGDIVVGNLTTVNAIDNILLSNKSFKYSILSALSCNSNILLESQVLRSVLLVK